MTEGIIIAIIAGVCSVLAAIAQRVYKKVNTIASDAKISREQTANTHNTNLRDDLDKVITGLSVVSAQLTDISVTQITQGGEIKRIVAKVEAQHKDDQILEDSIERASLVSQRALAAAIQDRQNELDELRREIPIIVHTVIKKGAE